MQFKNTNKGKDMKAYKIHKKRVKLLKDMIREERERKNLSLEDEVEFKNDLVVKKLKMKSIEELYLWLGQCFEISGFLESGSLIITHCEN